MVQKKIHTKYYLPWSVLPVGVRTDGLGPFSNICQTSCREPSVSTEDIQGDDGMVKDLTGLDKGGVFSFLHPIY